MPALLHNNNKIPSQLLSLTQIIHRPGRH